MNQKPCCWCGNSELNPFSSDYLRCSACETLVLAHMPGPEISVVTNDDRGLYGREYWFSHQEKDCGYPNIQVRSGADLPERCLHWLRAVLKYKLPPAHVLELGSAHGGFVALLNWAGYQAMGLELSPWVADFARKTFDVPILLGPVETQNIPFGSLDVIALMDVLEHLYDPTTTVQYCLKLLKSDGFLIVQTPRYSEGRDHSQLLDESDPFIEQLKADEHLFLFSRRSVREFFRRLGVEHVLFEPAVFEHYDMFFVASKVPRSVNPPPEISKALTSRSETRLVQALLDLDKQFRDLKTSYNIAEADRATRLHMIQQLTARVKDTAVEAQQRLDDVHTLTSIIKIRDTRITDLETMAEERLTALQSTDMSLRKIQAEAQQRLDDVHTLTSIIRVRDERIRELENAAVKRLDGVQAPDQALKQAEQALAKAVAREQLLDGENLALRTETLLDFLIRKVKTLFSHDRRRSF